MPDTLTTLTPQLAEPAVDDRFGAWRTQFFSTQTIDVSVCIANWNCRDLLRQCVRSILNSQGVRFEVIVVDNASTDGAAAMLADEFPEVQVIGNARNLGFSRANNQAARRARGRCLFFLNNDTVLPPTALARLVAYLDHHPDVGMVGPRLRDPLGRVQVSFRPQPTVWSLLHRTTLLRWSGLMRGSYQRFRRIELARETPQAAEVLMGAAVILRRDFFFKIGGWDEDFDFGGEDMELCLRVRRHAPVMHLPDVEITHFGRASTRQNIAFAAPRIAVGFVRYLRKSGASETELLCYKVVTTLDAPLQLLVKGVQWLVRQLAGRRDRAAKSLLAMRTLWHFMRGLPAFWRA
jgi:GT2 family glycosyltransferase